MTPPHHHSGMFIQLDGKGIKSSGNVLSKGVLEHL